MKAVLIFGIVLLIVGYGWSAAALDRSVNARLTRMEDQLTALELRKDGLTREAAQLEAVRQELTTKLAAQQARASQSTAQPQTAAQKAAAAAAAAQLAAQQQAAADAAARQQLLLQQMQQARRTTRAS